MAIEKGDTPRGQGRLIKLLLIQSLVQPMDGSSVRSLPLYDVPSAVDGRLGVAMHDRSLL
jgi:hypothetical protein